MRRICRFIISPWFILMIACTAVAAEEPTNPPAPGSPEAVWSEIQARVERQNRDLDELKLRLAATADAELSFSLQREVARIKQQTELDVMEIQRKHAEIRGDAELVRKLEEAIHRIKHPEEVMRELQAAHPTPPGSSN